MRRNSARTAAAAFAVIAGMLMIVPSAVGATGNGSITLTSPVNNQPVSHHVEIDWTWRTGTYVKSSSKVNVEVSTNGFSWAALARNVRITTGTYLWDTSAGWPDAAYAVRVTVVGTTIKTIKSPIYVDNTIPAVRITNPTQGSIIVDGAATPYPNVIAGTAQVSAEASDNMTGVSKIEWFVDTVDDAGKIGEGAALTHDFGANPGQHVLWARSSDRAGNLSTPAQISIVAVPGPSTLSNGEPPAVPSPSPSGLPTGVPTDVPSPSPSGLPTEVPTPNPGELPTEVPTPGPAPTGAPTDVPTDTPSPNPSPDTGLLDDIVPV